MSSPSPLRAGPRGAQGGFTLVEVLVASLLLVMVVLGSMALVIKSYEITADARLRDNARGVLRTFGDQFLRLNPIDGPTGQTKRFFNNTYSTGATSDGLVWGQFCDDLGGDGSAVEDLNVPLRGEDDTTAIAVVRREVKFVSSSSGAILEPSGQGAVPSRDLQAAGYFIVATFSATYTFKGKQRTESMTFLRLITG